MVQTGQTHDGGASGRGAQVTVQELLTEGTTITLRHKGHDAGALRVGKVIMRRSFALAHTHQM